MKFLNLSLPNAALMFDMVRDSVWELNSVNWSADWIPMDIISMTTIDRIDIKELAGAPKYVDKASPIKFAFNSQSISRKFEVCFSRWSE